MTRESDLEELGLSPDEEHDATTIRKAYLKLSRERHPDKGGTKESFQRLVNAYERLSTSQYVQGATAEPQPAPAAAAAATAPREAEEPHFYQYEYDEEEQDYWYGAHYNFHRYTWDFTFDDLFGDFFSGWHRERHHARRRARSGGPDWRDRKAKHGAEKCMFCGINAPIKKRKAQDNGLNWEEYIAHPNKYKTCWECKNAHKSVMTELMARERFAHVLDPKKQQQQQVGGFKSIFQLLREERKSFHHQPVTMACELTRNNEYFWYPDLEEVALARGWKPRGKKKEEVPWMRKDIDVPAVVVTPERKRKKRSRKSSKESSASKKPKALNYDD